MRVKKKQRVSQMLHLTMVLKMMMKMQMKALKMRSQDVERRKEKPLIRKRKDQRRLLPKALLRYNHSDILYNNNINRT